MKVAKEQDRERILQYLKKNVQECLYLYIDITNYGIASENIRVWYEEENGELSLVAMKYYDSYQIYSHKREGDLEELWQLLQDDPASMISGRKDLIERLERMLPDYRSAYGVVFHVYPSELLKKTSFQVKQASERDVPDIVKLLCSEANFGVQYTAEILQAQLEERIRTGTGRSYIVRADDTNEVIAHMATFAETQDTAVVSGSVVSRKYRKTSVFEELDNYMCYQLGRENKSVFAFSTSKAFKYLAKMWNTGCGEYGKLIKKEDQE